MRAEEGRRRRAPKSVATRRAPRTRTWALLAAFAVVGLAYAPSLRVPYLFDDHGALEENPYLGHPGTFEWLVHVPENSALIARPFLGWTFGVDALLFGSGVTGSHVVNLLIHLANLTLVAALLRRGLAAAEIEEPLRSATAVAVALVWGLHPLNVQAVAYLIQRSESLATLLELLTLYAWIRSGERGASSGWLVLACAAPFAAVATKEHGWIAPVLPLLWAWIFLGRTPVQELRRLPVFYAAGASSWGLLVALTVSGGRLLHVNAAPEIDAWTYFVNQPRVLTHYVRLFLFPDRQSFDYDWPVASLASAWPWLVLWGGLFAASAYAGWRRWPAGFPAALLFLSLSTTSSFVALPDLAFEHRFYLAGACAAALLVTSVAYALQSRPWALRVAAAGLAIAAIALGVRTAQRCALFQSEMDVWREALERNPDQRRALSNVGGILLKQRQPAEALGYFRKVEALGIPERMRMRIHYQTGNALLDLGRNAEARDYFQKALAEVRGEPGPIYVNLGHSYLREGNYAEARTMFQHALSTLESDANLQFDFAYASLQLGEISDALRAYQLGLRLGGRPQSVLKQQMDQLSAVFSTDASAARRR